MIPRPCISLRMGDLSESPTLVPVDDKDGALTSMAYVGRLELARMLFDPTFDDHFFVGIKLDGVASLGVHVAEEAAFPSGEGKVGHGGGYADVDADVSGRGFVAESACGGSARGEERRLVAIRAALEESD